MAHDRKFRFGVQARSAGPRDEWLETIRRVEASGYSTYVMLDHFVRGLDPIAALGAAAMVTSSLRLGTMVIDNDFRHPVVLTKAMATLDVLSGGRLEIGIGAGWLREEYEQSGIPFDAPGLRIERMIETVRFMRQAFVEDEISFQGRFVQTKRLTLPPKPVQQPSPPIVIGGGGKRMLSVAARLADIVGFTSQAQPDGSKRISEMSGESMLQKVGWVREAAGARFAELELTAFLSEMIVSGDRDDAADAIAATQSMTREDVLSSPYYLIGSADEMVEQ
jgi:probable F420-dependent oxidoreductase